MNLKQAWDLLSWGSPLGFAFSFLLGSIFGSFANVVIWRLPRGQSLIKPGSRCPACGTAIPLWRNIPVLSYFLLRGKAACCGVPLSARYPLVEMLCALILGVLYLNGGWNFAFLFQSAWMILLVILAAIDIEHFRLPNTLVMAGALLSVLWMVISPQQSWPQAGLGLAAGLVMASVMLMAGRSFAGRWGGFGDFKLTAVLGFTFGLGPFLILYLTASLGGLIYAVSKRRTSTDQRIPMGPFFALGAWITILCGDTVVRWYLGLYNL